MTTRDLTDEQFRWLRSAFLATGVRVPMLPYTGEMEAIHIAFVAKFGVKVSVGDAYRLLAAMKEGGYLPRLYKCLAKKGLPE